MSQLRQTWPGHGYQVTWMVKNHLVPAVQFLIGIWIPPLSPPVRTSACPCSRWQAVPSTAVSVLQRCRRGLWDGAESSTCGSSVGPLC